jgi:hypothetical protein
VRAPAELRYLIWEPGDWLKLARRGLRHASVGRCTVRIGVVFLVLLTAAVNAAQPGKIFVFLAGMDPERISGEAVLGEARGSLELTRSTPSYDIESMRTFSRQCPAVTMTTRRDKANVILRIERDEPSPVTPFVKANRIAVFNLDDELVYATRARLLSNASKDACRAILNYVKR